jgi:hypothetical protein
MMPHRFNTATFGRRAKDASMNRLEPAEWCLTVLLHSRASSRRKHASMRESDMRISLAAVDPAKGFMNLQPRPVPRSAARDEFFALPDGFPKDCLVAPSSPSIASLLASTSRLELLFGQALGEDLLPSAAKRPAKQEDEDEDEDDEEDEDDAEEEEEEEEAEEDEDEDEEEDEDEDEDDEDEEEEDEFDDPDTGFDDDDDDDEDEDFDDDE